MEKISKNRVKELARLRQKKHRLEEQLVVVEGLRTLSQLKYYGLRPLEQYLGESGQAIWAGVPALQLDAEDFHRICDSDNPQAVAALFALPAAGVKSFKTAFYLDGISDPGNMGSIFRSAAAFGLDALLLSPCCVEVSSPKVIRASLGSVYRVPHAIIEPGELSVPGLQLVCAEMREGTLLQNFRPAGGRLVVAIGSEARGLSRQIREMAGESLRIGMEEQMESLNAAMAASIIAYHLHTLEQH